MRPIPLSKIKLNDPFWTPWHRKLSEVTLLKQFEQISEHTGRLRNFERVAKGESGGHEGRYYDDSDVYKWVEACGYALLFHPHEPLTKALDRVISAICSAQEPDGYINTFFQLNHPDKKFLNLSFLHEMYCMGHLFEAGVALDECLSDRRLLDVSIKCADLLVETFGEGKREGYCGHQEVELALIRLGDHVNDSRYRNLARLMIERRGHRPTIFEKERENPEVMELSPWAGRYLNLKGEYFQDHAPIREHRIVVGHAVRAMYFYSAAAQLDLNDSGLNTALRSVWDNMVNKRMYITGGIGSTADNEGFTHDYELPNHKSYAETCAAVGLAMWGRTMLEHTGDSEFADVLERAIFNGSLAGISADGAQYFYANPLESRFDHARVPWFDCACCPPNIARLIGSIAKFAVSEGEDSLWIHFPIAGTFSTNVNGVPITLTIDSNYPSISQFKLKISVAKPVDFSLCIRMPQWCDDAELTSGDETHEANYENGYFKIDQQWSGEQEFEVDWNAEPKWIQSHPSLFENLGTVALQIGPLTYCLESLDSQKPAQWFWVDPEAEVEFADGRASCLGYWLKPESEPQLYESASDYPLVEGEAEFIPYYSWANRGKSSMLVWVKSVG